MVAFAEYRLAVNTPLPHMSGSNPRERTRHKDTLQWLSDYEQRSNSVFKYYSVPNEIEFLKKENQLTVERQQYYVEENVKRFLGEFVGKVPYTTIPYEIDSEGFTYASMHVMGSYENAARLGGQRERAEVEGFQKIESAMVQSLHKQPELQSTAFWISPPKIADYGFVFVMKPEENGRIKEYILRYPEKQTDLTKSSHLFRLIDPSVHLPENTDEFLRSPLFGTKGGDFSQDLHAIMSSIGITQEVIDRSRYFEDQIDKKLGSWITQYAKSVIDAARLMDGNESTHEHVNQCKLLLLSLYQQAQDIMHLYPYRHLSSAGIMVVDESENEFTWERFAGYSTQLANQQVLPTATAGSCPAIDDPASTLDPVTRYVSNHDIISQLRTATPEQIVQNKNVLTKDDGTEKKLDCTCPFCQEKVSAVIANGTITCPRKECGKSGPYAC